MEAIRVSHVQHFSVNDGEGIRTTVFLSGCPLRCSWCCNPETWDADPDTAAYTPAARKILGRFMSVDEILGEIRRYSIFHGSSGGGVTWSGGEPFFFPSKLRALVDACADLGIHQAVETSCFFPWSSCEDILESLDFLFVDIKHMDSGTHKRLTGVGNETILKNIERIGSMDIETVVRVPLVRGANDDEDNLARTAGFVRDRMRRKRMELLPYHDLGRDKYDILGMGERRIAYERIGREGQEKAEAIVAREGVEIVRYR
ncbi:MAG: glycyl-radical enzyme activating protein [Rectinemataceae bacterium]